MIMIALLKFAIYPITIVCISYVVMRVVTRLVGIKDESFIVKGSFTYPKEVDASIRETIRLVNRKAG